MPFLRDSWKRFLSVWKQKMSKASQSHSSKGASRLVRIYPCVLVTHNSYVMVCNIFRHSSLWNHRADLRRNVIPACVVRSYPLTEIGAKRPAHVMT